MPCLATLTPQAAATKAAAVEMLKVFLPSPPVPTTSNSGPSALTRRAFSRITAAMPAISSVLSPFNRRAVRKAPNWAGVASPSIISCITSVACSRVREWPETTISIASRIIGDKSSGYDC